MGCRVVLAIFYGNLVFFLPDLQGKDSVMAQAIDHPPDKEEERYRLTSIKNRGSKYLKTL